MRRDFQRSLSEAVGFVFALLCVFCAGPDSIDLTTWDFKGSSRKARGTGVIGIHEFGGRQFPPAELLPSSAARGWNGVAAELRNHPPGEILALVPEQMEITLATARCDAARVQRRGNGDCRDTPLAAGTLRLCPIGVPEESVRILGFPEGILHIVMSKEVFADISRSSSSAARAENVP